MSRWGLGFGDARRPTGWYTAAHMRATRRRTSHRQPTVESAIDFTRPIRQAKPGRRSATGVVNRHKTPGAIRAGVGTRYRQATHALLAAWLRLRTTRRS